VPIENNLLTKNIMKPLSPYDPKYILKGFILIIRNTEDPIKIFDQSCDFCGIKKPVMKYSTTNTQQM